MPFPLIPVIIAAAASAVVVGAVIYFFVSNDGNKKRVEYMNQVNQVLDLLQNKVIALKEKILEKEDKISELEKKADENRKEIEKLRADIQNYRENLEKSEKEKTELASELESWKNMEERLRDGLNAPTAIAAAGMLKASPIFKEVRYKPEKAFEYLDNRIKELNNEVSILN